MKVVIQNYSQGQKIFHSELIILKGKLTIINSAEGSSDGAPIQSPSVEHGFKGTGTLPFKIWHCRQILGGGGGEEEVPVPYFNYKNYFVCILKLGGGCNLIKFCDIETEEVFDEFSLMYCPEENTNQHYIRILHVVSASASKSSGKSEENILPKLNLGLALVQSLFAEKLYENGFERRSFKLRQAQDKGDENGFLFEIGLTPEEISEMSTSALWEYIAKEIRSRKEVWNKNCKYVAFVSQPWKAHLQDHHNPNDKLALGGGGLAIVCTSFLEVWPESVKKILEKVFSSRKLWSAELENCASRFGSVDRTEGSLYGTSLGSVAHEMGHIFDLGHADAGLMGSQFNRMDTSLSPVLSYPPVGELFRLKLGSDVTMLRPKVGLPNSASPSEDLLSIGISCATLLYFHKWFQPKSEVGVVGQSSKEEEIVLIKNKVVAKSSPLVTLQVRDVEDERLLKSWTFVEKSSRDPSDPVVMSSGKEFTLAKNHIPIQSGQQRDKALVVAEDGNGNLLKVVVNRDSLSESFTVVRRRT